MGKKTGGNAIFEDNFDLCIKMMSHRELLRLRFNDPGSRVRWNEALAYALRGYKSFKAFSEQGETESDNSGEQYGDIREDSNNNFVDRATMIISTVKSKVNPLLSLVDEDGATRNLGGRKRRASAIANDFPGATCKNRWRVLSATNLAVRMSDADLCENSSDEESTSTSSS